MGPLVGQCTPALRTVLHRASVPGSPAAGDHRESSSLKVLHVIPSIGPLRGGPGFVLRNLVQGLAARGSEVHVATTDDNGGVERLKVPLGVPISENNVTYWYFARQTGFYTSSLPLARWLLERMDNYDLVHIHA